MLAISLIEDSGFNFCCLVNCHVVCFYQVTGCDSRKTQTRTQTLSQTPRGRPQLVTPESFPNTEGPISFRGSWYRGERAETRRRGTVRPPRPCRSAGEGAGRSSPRGTSHIQPSDWSLSEESACDWRRNWVVAIGELP